MLIKTTIAVAAALVLGAASLASASENDNSGGARAFGNNSYATSGVNAAMHPHAASTCAKKYKSYDPATMSFVGADGLRHPCP
jgi:hypothetical protein